MDLQNTLYFEQEGKEYTEATLEAVNNFIERSNVDTVVIASTTGQTALRAGQILNGNIRIIAVPFQSDRQAKWGAPSEKTVQECKKLNVEFLPEEPKVSFIDKERPDVVNAWRVLSRGFKVAVQCASMCVDTGLISEGKKVIALGGRVHGADTAVVLETYGFENILKSNVINIIALPKKKFN